MSDKQLKIICYFIYRLYRLKVNSCYGDTYKEMYEQAEKYADKEQKDE